MSRAKSPKSRRRQKKSAPGDDHPLLDGDWKLRGRAATVSPDDYEPLRPWFGGRFVGRLWNLVVGLSLLPFCWILTDAIFTAFAQSKVRGSHVPFWKTHDFLMFGCGAMLWMIWFIVSICIWRQPRPIRAYVWGHELMHVLTARLFGGKIKDYEITRDGGYIVTDRYNFLIALAPYLWPFAAVPVLAIWGIVGWMPEAIYHREWFLGALGFSWAFHLSFTGWMIPIGQSDFVGPGRVFSLNLIYLFNVILLSACVVALAPEVTWRGYWRELSASAVHFYQHALQFGGDLVGRLGL